MLPTKIHMSDLAENVFLLTSSNFIVIPMSWQFFHKGWHRRTDFALRMGTRPVGVRKAHGGSLAELFKCCVRFPTQPVSAWISEAGVKIIMGELSMMREYRAYEQSREIASVSVGKRPLHTSKKASNVFPLWKLQCWALVQVHRVFLSSRGILEEGDNMLLPPQEPDRSSSQFSSLHFPSSRMAGNTL